MKPVSTFIVDENPLFVEIVTQYLFDDCPNEVTVVGSAANYREAAAQARILRPEVILLDLGLPGLRGLAGIIPLRTLLPTTKIIVLTLWDRPDYRALALNSGADYFIQKDLVFFELVPAISRLMSGNREVEMESMVSADQR